MIPTSGDPLFAQLGVATEDIQALLDMASGTDITELDVTVNGAHVRLRRPPNVPLSDVPPASLASDVVGDALASSVPLAIASPMVGLFRAAVSAGEAVQTGQSIGRIEVLGMPTSVEAPQSGTVDEVLVSDGSPVEYGQPLLTLRRAVHAP
ncbi:MAG: acetyl-CoA carboxylase biotin carboxyl carrier protein [Chloroflexota bacterium]